MSSSGRRKSPRVILGPRVDGGGAAASGDGGELSVSGSDVEGVKRRKPGSPLVDGALVVIGADSAVVGGAGETVVRMCESSSCESRESRSRRKKKKKAAVAANANVGDVPAGVGVSAKESVAGMAVSAGGASGRVHSLTRRISRILLSADLAINEKEKIMDCALEYQELVVALIAANERLGGELCGLKSSGAVGRIPVQAPMRVPVPVVNGAVSYAGVAAGDAPPAPPPRTYAVAVKAKDGAASADVASLVKEKVAPALGTRVHAVHKTKEGAIIRTPSEAERKKILSSQKFGEVGLEVSVFDRLGPKIVVREVRKICTSEAFLEGLYEYNLKEVMPHREFAGSVRLVTKGWKEDNGFLDVTLECTPRVAEHLRSTGVYYEYHRYGVRVLDPVATCHRCCGFGHMARSCRFKHNVCRRCGQEGHMLADCVNPVNCRNCALRRKPADHMMLSLMCPEYALMVARVGARH